MSEFCRTNQIHAMWLACDYRMTPRASRLLLYVRAADALSWRSHGIGQCGEVNKTAVCTKRGQWEPSADNICTQPEGVTAIIILLLSMYSTLYRGLEAVAPSIFQKGVPHLPLHFLGLVAMTVHVLGVPECTSCMYASKHLKWNVHPYKLKATIKIFTNNMNILSLSSSTR